MNNKEIIKLLNEIHSISISRDFIDGTDFEFSINSSEKVDQLQALGLEIEEFNGNKYRININELDFNVFYDSKDFRQHCKLSVFENDIGIITFEDTFLFYNRKDISKIRDLDEPIEDDQLLFLANAYFYLKFIDYLVREEIVAYKSIAERELIITSTNKLFYLGYRQSVPDIPINLDLKAKYSELSNKITNPELKIFFKEKIIDLLESFPRNERFLIFFEKMGEIVDATIRDYKIYLKRFSFDELRNELREERDEYFNSVRRIVDDLLTRIVAIPLSISASAYAIYKLSSDKQYIVVILIAYLVYSIFSSYLIRLVHLNLLDIEYEFKSDVKRISSESGLPGKIIEIEKKKVLNNVGRLKLTIWVIQIILLLLSLGLVFVSTFSVSIYYRLALFVLLLIGHLISMNYGKMDSRIYNL